jgi:hypothetical protein
MTAAAAPLDRAAFRRWLEAKRAWAPVGYLQHSEQCPLARYLDWVTGDPWIVYGPDADRGFRTGEWTTVPLPQWAARFTELVDRLPDERPGWERRTRVTAAVALELLDQAEGAGR